MIAYLVHLLVSYLTWFQGWYTTLYANFCHARYPLTRTTFLHDDGEESIVLIATLPTSLGNHVFLLLPGGMTSGDTFYTHQALASGVFNGASEVHVFHNPGILNLVRHKPVASLTDTRYVLSYLRSLYAKDGVESITIIGFSAGSMLATAVAYNPSVSHMIRGVIGVHGPDRIRCVFEHHQRSKLRLDVPFAYSLYRTMRKQPAHTNQNLGSHPARYPWLKGWNFMKSYTESVFGTPWMDMEDDHWCVRHHHVRSKCPVKMLRILSENDTIVPLETCDVEGSRRAFDQVILQRNG
eukprot:PhF_6_TR43356/c0_g1_i5/m.66433